MPAYCQSKPMVPMKAALVSWLCDVVDLQPAGRGAPQKEVGLAGNAAEIPDAGELPVESDGADEGGVGDGIVGDVVDLKSTGIGVAQQHVAFAEAAEIADAGELTVQA